MQKKATLSMIITMIGIMAILLFLPMPAQAATGWQKKGNDWYYYYTDNDYYQDTIEEIDGKSYIFDEKGVMRTGWYARYGLWYFAKSSGELVTGWQKIGIVWYYFDPLSFDMYSNGWYDIDGKRYSFSASGAMQTGWIKTTGVDEYGNPWTEWYYAGSSGAFVTGWQKIGSVWYYFDPVGYWMLSDGIYTINGAGYYFYPNGAMGTGWIAEVFKEIGWTNWYYANGSGQLQSGWQKIGGVWYFFNDPDFYSMLTGKQEINGVVYIFHSNGALASGGWVRLDSYDGAYDWYYTRPNGTPVTGWIRLNDVWYYLDPENAYMLYSTTELINGQLYAFSQSGALFTGSGWRKLSNSQKPDWVYLENDSIHTGWLTLGDKEYYLDPNTGIMVTGAIAKEGYLHLFKETSGEYKGIYDTPGWYYDTINGLVYYIQENGHTATGWQELEGAVYYFDPYECWMYANGVYPIEDETVQRYYFDKNGRMQTGWINTKDGETYFAAPSGVLTTGWMTLDGKTYYFDPDYCYMYRGGVWLIDGKQYYFDENGVCAVG